MTLDDVFVTGLAWARQPVSAWRSEHVSGGTGQSLVTLDGHPTTEVPARGGTSMSGGADVRARNERGGDDQTAQPSVDYGLDSGWSRRDTLRLGALAAAAVTVADLAGPYSPAHAGIPAGLTPAAAPPTPPSWVVQPFANPQVSLAPSLFTANRDRILTFARSPA